MRIKKQYTRQQLEAFSIRRIKRMFMIARNSMFTKMRLIDKVMRRMDEVYPKSAEVEEAPKHIPEYLYNETNYVTDDSLLDVELLQEQLQNIKWQQLTKLYGIPLRKGMNKQKAIKMILDGELKLKQPESCAEKQSEVEAQ